MRKDWKLLNFDIWHQIIDEFGQLQLDDAEYSIPHVDMMPSLESVLNELDTDSDAMSDVSRITPTPSMDDRAKTGTMLRQAVLQGITAQLASASVIIA